MKLNLNDFAAKCVAASVPELIPFSRCDKKLVHFSLSEILGVFQAKVYYRAAL